MFSRRTGRILATPLFIVLVLVETTDVVFAVDSVPAILAISREPFIVFASNAFAILGLRALYFLLAGAAGRFRYLNIGLGFILGFVGLKMLAADPTTCRCGSRSRSSPPPLPFRSPSRSAPTAVSSPG